MTPGLQNGMEFSRPNPDTWIDIDQVASIRGGKRWSETFEDIIYRASAGIRESVPLSTYRTRLCCVFDGEQNAASEVGSERQKIGLH